MRRKPRRPPSFEAIQPEAAESPMNMAVMPRPKSSKADPKAAVPWMPPCSIKVVKPRTPPNPKKAPSQAAEWWKRWPPPDSCGCSCVRTPCR